jgi:hypothetical protein
LIRVALVARYGSSAVPLAHPLAEIPIPRVVLNNVYVAVSARVISYSVMMGDVITETNVLLPAATPATTAAAKVRDNLVDAEMMIVVQRARRA